MAKQKVLTDVPDADVQEVMDDFKSEGCNPVTKTKQDNGKWTVKATCPDEVSPSRRPRPSPG